MHYEYVTQAGNYEDYAAGRVLLSAAGTTAFPVRLASELFQRAAALYPNGQRLRVYDPCGGSGYLLTVLGFLHRERIASLIAADVDARAVHLARANLNLLTAAGLAQRRATLQRLYAAYGKLSHAQALVSVDTLAAQLPPEPLITCALCADAFAPCLAPRSVDVLITDVPYGGNVGWVGPSAAPLRDLLAAQMPLLAPEAVVFIVSDKAQKAAHPAYERLLHSTLGKRRITILRAA